MKAVIEELEFEGGKIVSKVCFYLDQNEDGYGKYLEDILAADGKPTGKKKLHPFHNLTSDIPPATTLETFSQVIQGRLDEFKAANAKLAEMQSWVGTEIEV